jgi:flavin reductase (DIM6/NTAB) family NADH-FMN oxidoreductase RutF
VFEVCSHYAVNILAADQVELSQRFSQSQNDRFAGIDTIVGAGGTPILPGCSAWFECRNEMRYPGGDHIILVGYVENFSRQEKRPLIFHGGQYRKLV